jgi:hypothetical protein
MRPEKYQVILMGLIGLVMIQAAIMVGITFLGFGMAAVQYLAR